MGKGFLTFTRAIILQAVANDYRHGFDIMDITGLPGGTVYPALRRLEDVGYLKSKWESVSNRPQGARPPRRLYEITRAGQSALEEASKRYRLLEQSNFTQGREPKPSKA